MEILAKVRTSTIYLKGDKEVEAVANYMWNKHHVYIYNDKTPTQVVNFACNFLMKYHADAVLMKGFAGIAEFEYYESIHSMTSFIEWYKDNTSFDSQEGKELGAKVIASLLA